MDTRRKLLVLGTGALAAPLAPFAQQRMNRLRRVGVLMGYAESDAEGQSRFAAFKERLQELGWVEGRNVTLDTRWAAPDVNRMPVFAKELVALRPDVITCSSTPAAAALQRETQTIPIVFTIVSDPVGSGFVKSFAKPGGNMTGFVHLVSSLVEKWLQLLKEIAPRVSRVGVMFNPQTAPYADFYLRPVQAAAVRIGVATIPTPVRTESEIEQTIGRLGAEPSSGLIVMPDSYLIGRRKLIVSLAAVNKVPTVYFVSDMATEGGLISYGIEYLDLFRRAAAYVDRILRGAKPAELPVQEPAKFELFINLKAAKALGLTIPQGLLLRAHKVIE